MARQPTLKIAVGLTSNLLPRIKDIQEYFASLKEKKYEPVFFVHHEFDQTLDPHEVKKKVVLQFKTPFVTLSDNTCHENITDIIFKNNAADMLNFPVVGLNKIANDSLPIVYGSSEDDLKVNRKTLTDILLSRWNAFYTIYNNMRNVEDNSLISFEHYMLLSEMDDINFIIDSEIDFKSLKDDILYSRRVFNDYSLMCAEWSTLLFNKNSACIEPVFRHGTMTILNLLALNKGYVQGLITCDHNRVQRIFPTLCAQNRIQLEGFAEI